jgi:hypothetical protein
MDYKLEGLCKESIVVQFQVSFCYLTGEAEESYENLRIIGVPTEIRNGNLPVTNKYHYWG